MTYHWLGFTPFLRLRAETDRPTNRPLWSNFHHPDVWYLAIGTDKATAEIIEPAVAIRRCYTGFTWGDTSPNLTGLDQYYEIGFADLGNPHHPTEWHGIDDAQAQYLFDHPEEVAMEQIL